MIMHRITLLSSLVVLAGCSLFGGKPQAPSTEVTVRTTPPGAQCSLVGQNEYQADVETPIRMRVRDDASPLSVTCVLEGYRPTHGTLTLSSHGWLMSTVNAIAGFGADSLSLIGIDIGDQSKGPETPTYDASMKPVVPQMIHVRQRDGQVDGDIKP